MQPATSDTVDRVLLKNTYLVEFSPRARVMNPFLTITKSLKSSNGIDEAAIQQRHIIQSPLFSGVSFSLNVEHSSDALEMIEEADAIYPVYLVRPPKPIIHKISSVVPSNNSADFVNSHNLTGVIQVHHEMNNYGKGVRVRKS